VQPHEDGAAFSRAPTVLDRMREALRSRHYSRRTEAAYCLWVKRYLRANGMRHPGELGEQEINAFLTRLAVDGKVSASTQNQALAALLFLYRNVVGRDVGDLTGVVRARKQKRLPVVLTRAEVRALLDQLDGVCWLLGSLMYGTGMRLSECLKLRVQDVDFASNQITVRDGKGGKDRVTMLPAAIAQELRHQMTLAKRVHDRDLAEGWGRVMLPDALTFNSARTFMRLSGMTREDFMAGVSANVVRTMIAGLLAALAVVAIGSIIMQWIARDVRRLADAARRIGEGDLHTPLAPQRTAELGMLAQSFERMQTSLRTDRLTGLSNRDAVIQRLTERMKKGRRHDDAPMMALLFVDLDRFKTVNDRFGHEAGDRVLLVMGKRLHDTVRDSDMVARWAGDEFVVLLDGVRDPSAPERVRAQIEEGLRQPVSVAEGQEPVTLGGSVGMALYPQDADEPADLIRLADEDMYRRKPVGATQW